MTKFVRVMDGLKSNAGGFEYKLDEINISEKWDTSTIDPELMGGFNFSTEDKILRWTHRGNTIYDVIIPQGAEVIHVDEEKGIYRSNKIIVTNPRPLTDQIVLDYYNKTTLSNKMIAECLQILLWKNRLDIVKHIIRDRVTVDNVDEIFSRYIEYASNGNPDYDFSIGMTGEVYSMLQEIQNTKGLSK